MYKYLNGHSASWFFFAMINGTKHQSLQRATVFCDHRCWFGHIFWHNHQIKNFVWYWQIFQSLSGNKCYGEHINFEKYFPSDYTMLWSVHGVFTLIMKSHNQDFKYYNFLKVEILFFSKNDLKFSKIIKSVSHVWTTAKSWIHFKIWIFSFTSSFLDQRKNTLHRSEHCRSFWEPCSII